MPHVVAQEAHRKHPAAAVAVDDPSSVTEEEIIAHVGSELAGYKKPRRVLVLSDLERSPSGKIDLARLRERSLRTGTPS